MLIYTINSVLCSVPQGSESGSLFSFALSNSNVFFALGFPGSFLNVGICTGTKLKIENVNYLILVFVLKL